MHKHIKQLARLGTPRNLWIAAALSLLLGAIGGALILPLLDHSDEELKDDLRTLIVNPPAVASRNAYVSAASNPLPNAGFPHGRGMTHGDFPTGYRFRDRPRATFNNYIDGQPVEFSDERHFLRACFINTTTDACLDRTSAPSSDYVRVAPGDRLIISILIHNNGHPEGNSGGDGPAIARNTRVSVAFPTRQRSHHLALSAYIYADNALVDESRPHIKTISDNLGFASATGHPIQLKYEPDKARVLQVVRAVDPDEDVLGDFAYRNWLLTKVEQHILFTGNRSAVEGNTEADPSLGLPLGSSGSSNPRTIAGLEQNDRLDFFAGLRYHEFVQFKIRVAGSWMGREGLEPSTDGS